MWEDIEKVSKWLEEQESAGATVEQTKQTAEEILGSLDLVMFEETAESLWIDMETMQKINQILSWDPNVVINLEQKEMMKRYLDTVDKVDLAIKYYIQEYTNR